MSRSSTLIYNLILSGITADSNLVTLSATSQTAIYKNFAFDIAVAMNLQEQLWDIFKDELETIALQAVPGTPDWLKSQVQKFQYGDVLQLINFVPTYPVIDTSLQIVSQCAVKQSSQRMVTVKVAKGITPNFVALNNTEVNALSDYINKLKFAGTSINLISLDADRLYVNSDIYYYGQYVTDTVKQNVINAINNYLSTLDFDGIIYLSKLETAILNAAGVKDVFFNVVKGRDNETLITSSDATTIIRNYETSAGYIIAEDTSGYTLSDSLNMILAS